MDFTNAALLIGAVFAITALLDKSIPALNGWKLQLANELVGVAVVFLVAYSTFAKAVEVGAGKSTYTLDLVNTAGLILIGLLIAGGATVVDRTIKAVRNVGQNQDPS